MNADQGTGEAVFRSLLAPGERILWSGQPGGGIRFRREDLWLVPGSLFFVCFGIFWEYGATQPLRSGEIDMFAYVFPLFGLAVIGAGAFQMFGRFLVNAYRRGRTDYAITTHRILILERAFSERLREENISAVDDTSLRRRRDGSGSIIIGPEPQFAEAFLQRRWRPPRPFALEFLPDIDRVVDILRRQQVALRSR